jgi:hypothetical protein
VPSLAGAVLSTRPTTSRRSGTNNEADTAAADSTATVDRTVPGHRVEVVAQPTASATGGRAAGSDATPAGLGMVGTDRVTKVREQMAARPMQRLSIELDDARVAIRVRGDKVSVDVTNDPKGALGEGWARQVERTIDRAVRTQDSESRGTNPDRRSGSQGRRDQSQRQQRRFEIDGRHLEPDTESSTDQRMVTES